MSKSDKAAPELLPCPFCGGEAREGKDGEYFLVGCTNCGAETSSEIRRVARSSWNRRADLAAPSAPAEVEGMVNYDLQPQMRALNAFRDQEALTALQAEIERLKGSAEFWENCAALSEKRAEKAEAERDAWKANAEALANALRHAGDTFWDHICDDALAAHTKLKGEA